MNRVIPCLLMRDGGLYKGAAFKNHRYVGDPFNAVRVFNGFEVDELALLDIGASLQGRVIDHEYIQQVASECFIPLTVGGGVKTVEQARKLLQCGAEKIVINSALFDDPSMISRMAEAFGSQSVVVSVDVGKPLFGGYAVYSHSGTRKQKVSLTDWVTELERRGAGELLLTSVDREGSMGGLDTKLISQVSSLVKIPVVAAGGAGSLSDIKQAMNAGANAVSAGAMFVFHGERRAVLISYPERCELESVLDI